MKVVINDKLSYIIARKIEPSLRAWFYMENKEACNADTDEIVGTIQTAIIGMEIEV